MTREEYKRQGNGVEEHEIYYPPGLDNQKRSKPRHAALCACGHEDNVIRASFDEREGFAAIYLGYQRCSDEPQEAPERTSEDEIDYHPTVGSTIVNGSTMIPQYALYSISHKKFIAILSQEKKVMEWSPAFTIRWLGKKGFLVPIEVALEMHSGAKFERERDGREVEKQKFIEDGQQFYAQLCTKVKKMAL